MKVELLLSWQECCIIPFMLIELFYDCYGNVFCV